MASWDFSDSQEPDNHRRPVKDKEGNKRYEDYKDEDGNWWTYGRRGWRRYGDYDG